MINGTSTELAKEFFSTKIFKVGNEIWPEMQDIIAREAVPFLQQYHLAAEKSRLDGRSEATWPSTYHQDLQKKYRSYIHCLYMYM